MKALHEAISTLQEGGVIQLRLSGNSMTPKVKNKQLVTIYPVGAPKTLKKGQVVLCKVKKRILLHLVTALEKNRVQISNNHGHINGWTSVDNIYGIMGPDPKPRKEKRNGTDHKAGG